MTSIIQKSFNIFVRTCAKPIIEWVVKNKKDEIVGNSGYGYLGKTLSFIGQKTNFYSMKFNRKVFKISNFTEIKPLSNEKALEKGTEIVTEILIYSILIVLPILEWRRQTKANLKKEIKEKEEMDKLYEKVFSLRREEKILEIKLSELREKMKTIDVQYKKYMSNFKVHI